LLQELKNTHIHENQQHAVKGVFYWDGKHAQTQVLRVVVPDNGLRQACTCQNAIDDEEWNQDEEKGKVKAAQKSSMPEVIQDYEVAD
jgi:hypothetical protein